MGFVRFILFDATCDFQRWSVVRAQVVGGGETRQAQLWNAIQGKLVYYSQTLLRPYIPTSGPRDPKPTAFSLCNLMIYYVMECPKLSSLAKAEKIGGEIF